MVQESVRVVGQCYRALLNNGKDCRRRRNPEQLITNNSGEQKVLLSLGISQKWEQSRQLPLTDSAKGQLEAASLGMCSGSQCDSHPLTSTQIRSIAVHAILHERLQVALAIPQIDQDERIIAHVKVRELDPNFPSQRRLHDVRALQVVEQKVRMVRRLNRARSRCDGLHGTASYIHGSPNRRKSRPTARVVAVKVQQRLIALGDEIEPGHVRF